jgi:hypothetical protein
MHVCGITKLSFILFCLSQRDIFCEAESGFHSVAETLHPCLTQIYLGIQEQTALIYRYVMYWDKHPKKTGSVSQHHGLPHHTMSQDSVKYTKHFRRAFASLFAE